MIQLSVMTKNEYKDQKILIVDDEEDIAELIRFHLDEEGFRTRTVSHGMEVMPQVEKFMPNLIILDLMLPGISGMDLCKKIKEKYDMPVIMVTAKSGETDAVLGLELGADDYIRKPFNVRELLARVRSVLRRFIEHEKSAARDFETGKIRLNSKAHRVSVDDKPVDLTLIEYNLLYHFLSNPGIVFSRELLLDRIWGSDVYVTDRAVDVNIKRLRDKLGVEKNRLETVRGVGYRFNES